MDISFSTFVLFLMIIASIGLIYAIKKSLEKTD